MDRCIWKKLENILGGSGMDTALLLTTEIVKARMEHEEEQYVSDIGYELEPVIELVGRYLAMTTEEKRRYFYGRKNFVMLEDINTWSEDYCENERHLKRICPQDTHIKNLFKGGFPLCNADDLINHLFKGDFPPRDVDEELNAKVSLYEGNITTLEIDGIVNSANNSLSGGYGINGVIHRAAGSKLQQECSVHGGCQTGYAKTTADIIHTVGPEGFYPNQLRSCYMKCLQQMLNHKMRSIAFCCISNRIYRYPNELAVHVALTAVYDLLCQLKQKNQLDLIDRIIFCVFLPVEVTLYQQWMQIYFPTHEGNGADKGASEKTVALRQTSDTSAASRQESSNASVSRSNASNSNLNEDEGKQDGQSGAEGETKSRENLETEGKDAEGDVDITPSAEEIVVARPRKRGKEKKLTNQFNFSERASQTCDNPMRLVDPSELSNFSIPRIHLTYENIRKHLTLFSELVQIWPESILRLAESRIPKNRPLDLICLLLLMQSYLIPKKDELDNINSRQRWVEKVRSMSLIVVRLLESVSSDIAQEHLQHRDTCRFTWNRVGAVQLFIEHVCPSDIGDTSLSVKRCMPLWTALTDKTDFKTLRSFETVEHFLRICNKNAADLYFGKLENCPGCEKSAEFPVKLPCGHILCARCLVETKELQVYKCHAEQCFKDFPKDIKATVVTAKKEGKEKYMLYKQRCNAFFMDLVSCFCFTDDSPPEPEVIQKLMGYVTRRSKLAEKIGGEALAAQQKTKKMFEESFDPTPVVRSFLLQLMLQTDIDSVHDYLEQYFENARALVQTDPAQVVELCVLCVQCLESAQCDGDVERLHFARDLLIHSANLLSGDLTGVRLDSLEAIARVRFGLLETAKWMHQSSVDKTTTTQEVRRLFDAAKRICDQEQLRWPRVYLMRQITRRYGMDALKSISGSTKLKWVLPKEARGNENDAVPDRFVICGENYTKLRELMTEIVLGKGVEVLEEALMTVVGSAEVVESLVLLAIYREVTATNVHADPRQRPTPEVLQRLTDFCMQSPVIRNKELAMEIVGNKMKGCVQVGPRQTGALTELIIHFKILMSNSKNNSLQKPFLDMIMTPQDIEHAYLPTMPQDDMDDVRAALALTAAEAATFYQCPNGHPYVIGNCGNPDQKSKCMQCRASIGGVDHRLVRCNTRIVHADTTRRGHVLGQPQKRAPNPERNMSPASTAILRMLLHMSMYLSSLENPQAVSPAIFPVVQPQEVSNFLLAHAQVDVETIHSATGHSEEDVIVFMHILIDSMIQNEQFVAGLDNSMKLQTKPSRVQWEDVYVNMYILPALNGLNARVQEANNRMVNDERLGGNPLLRIVFEVDVPITPANIQRIHEEPSLWRFRSHISLEHLAHALDEDMAQKKGDDKKQKLYPILHLFLKDEHQLRAIRLLPSIIRLHQLLLQKLNRCLDNSDATTMTIGSFLDDQDENQRQTLQDLILKDFADAWDCVRPSLANYVFSGYTIPMDYIQEPVNVNSRLGMLLPSLRGWGLCSVALIYYLQELQNNYLENYSKEKKQTLKARVDIYDASYAHFIAYHPVHDLQPIILANCNYSLEVGKGTTIEYDFGSMEKQITKRFIRGRPRLGIGRMEFILYREDFANAAIFSQLRSRIPQEPLQSQAEMERELKSRFTDVTDLLASLNIAVGFLVSIGGDPEMNVLRFMTDTLKMKQPRIAQMLETCRLKHVESLWLLLSYLRASMQASYGQDAFENVDEKYREPVPDELKPKLRLGFQHIQMDSFLILLYECIIFNITVKQNVNADDYADNSDYLLRDVLNLYMDDSGSNYSIPALQDGRFPEEIKAKHCIAT